jgi:hypothetical protein
MLFYNWTEWNGPKDQFHQNVNSILTSNINFRFIESDFRKVDYSQLGKFNVYLFDGPHQEQDQYDGIKLALPALDDTFILIVDDWNWAGPRNGTLAALSKLGTRVLAGLEIRTTDDESHAFPSHENSDWHNGYFIAIISKK